MAAAMCNPFVFSKPVTGDAFIGREEELRILSNGLFRDKMNYVLVAPTKAGKSSVIEELIVRNREVYPRIMFVKLSMGDCDSALGFWYTLCEGVRKALLEKGVEDDDLKTEFDNLKEAYESPIWYTPMQTSLKTILTRIGELDYQVTFFVDEFDAALDIFGTKSSYYQLLRSICYTPQFASSALLASRRRLPMYEAKCPAISTFHGIFEERALHAFSDEEMACYYQKLEDLGVTFSSGGKKRLDFFTGRQSYMCVMMARKMVECIETCSNYGDKEVDQIFKNCYSNVDMYYKSLYDRLEEDDHLDFLWYLAKGLKAPRANEQHFDNMETMGVLTKVEKNGTDEWFSYSKSFMSWLVLQPAKLPTWETITACEKKLKEILSEEYPALKTKFTEADSASQSGMHTRISQELHVDWDKLRETYTNCAPYNPEATLADCMTLTWTINVMQRNWDERFSKYFTSFNGTDWTTKLETIKRLRLPIAHAGLEYIDELELATCMKYCTEVISTDV